VTAKTPIHAEWWCFWSTEEKLCRTSLDMTEHPMFAKHCARHQEQIDEQEIMSYGSGFLTLLTRILTLKAK
jgi:hypothetical protein